MSCDGCAFCKNAIWDYKEYYGGHKQWFVEGCVKDAEAKYNVETGNHECDEYKEVQYV